MVILYLILNLLLTHALTDHFGEPQTEMGVFLSRACRSVWNSVFDLLINLISLKSPSQLRYLFTRFGTGSPS